MGDFRDPAVAENWHATQLAHRARGRQLDLLIDLLVGLAPERLVDIGVGSGLVAERVLGRLPGVALVGVDFSPVMLAEARTRLAPFEDRVQLVEGDLSRPEAIAVPDGGTFDAAITVQTLHNIGHEGQQRALAWTRSALEPAGVLLSLDKVAVPRPLYGLYVSLAPSSTLGAFPESFDDYEDRGTRAGEHSPPLATYLAWLRDAGFEAGVLDVEANYALVAAVRERDVSFAPR
jgi:SAM-dependent methyltransferase